jgi:two-component system sensor histidine kinase DegS
MNRLKRIGSRQSFWILTVMLVVLGFFHYLTPQVRFLPTISHPLNRHAVERIIFILPIAGATFAFGQVGGLVALFLGVLTMLPRAFWLSPYPVDAFMEILAVGVVGYLVVWMIETQEREKRLRQEIASRLRTTNAVTSIVTGSLELEQVLNGALDKVLEVMRVKVASIYLLDEGTSELVLTAYRGLSPACARETARLKLGASLAGWVGQSGESAVVDDIAEYPLDDSMPVTCLVGMEGMRSFIAVPLKSSDSVLGVMTLADSQRHLFTSQDVQLLTAIGGQVGVAIENARLYENMRFYARQITRAQEEERMRIARDLHDETIQMLIAISRRIEALATLPEPAMQRLVELQELVSETLKGLRRFVQDLRPSTLDYLGLMAALLGAVNDLEEKDGVAAEVKAKGEVRRLAPEQELGLFRIFQEALNNIRRHSESTHAVVEVAFYPGKIQMLISDNGRGFDVPERMDGLVPMGKLGLIGMYERARLLGGTLVIKSGPDKGTTIIVDVPIQPGQKSEDDTTQDDVG